MTSIPDRERSPRRAPLGIATGLDATAHDDSDDDMTGGGAPTWQSILNVPNNNNYAFKKVKGPLLEEAKKAYRKHQTALRDACVGLQAEDRTGEDLGRFKKEGHIPSWIRPSTMPGCKRSSLQASMSTVHVSQGMKTDLGLQDSHGQTLAEVLGASHPWLKALPMDNNATWNDLSVEALLKTLHRETASALLHARAIFNVQQRTAAQASASEGSFKADLKLAFDRLFHSAEELTGLTNLADRFAPEWRELEDFHDFSCKALLAHAAANKTRAENKQAAARKQETATEDKVLHADFKTVLEAAVKSAVTEALQHKDQGNKKKGQKPGKQQTKPPGKGQKTKFKMINKKGKGKGKGGKQKRPSHPKGNGKGTAGHGRGWHPGKGHGKGGKGTGKGFNHPNASGGKGNGSWTWY